MITDVEYMQLVNEVYDLSDYHTKKKVLLCNEAQKMTNVENIVGRLYKHIKNDVTGIDFGSIPKSKGVITNIDNFSDMVDCINSIHDLVMSYNERTTQPDVYSTAIANIQNRERLFSKAFALNIELPMMIYNITVTSIVSAISLLISASVEFVKNGHDSFNAAFDKAGYNKSKDHVLYEYLVQFNNACSKGTLDKLINGCIKNNLVATKESADVDSVNEGLLGDIAKEGIGAAVAIGANTLIGGTVGTIIMVGSLAIMLLWSMRKAIYYLLRARMSISDWFEAQATYLQINAENLKYREDDLGEDHQKKVYQKQMKWVEKFKKLSNFFALKDAKAKKEAKQDEDKEDRSYDDNDDDDGGLF